MKSISFSNQGKRTYQEDYLYSNKDIGLFIVCDGVGGAAKGGEASKLVTTTIQTLVEKEGKIPLNDVSVNEIIIEVEKALQEKIVSNPETVGMGTTLTMLFIHDNGATLAHIGDSRIYYIKPTKGKYWRTKDHSLVQELFDGGILKDEAAMETHPMRNRITRALQAKKDIKPVTADILTLNNLEKGDLFFLCSDGVLEPYSEDNFVPILANQQLTIRERLKIIQHDCAESSSDNNTCILIKLEEKEAIDSEKALDLNWRQFPILSFDGKNNDKITIKSRINNKIDSISYQDILAVIALVFVIYLFFFRG